MTIRLTNLECSFYSLNEYLGLPGNIWISAENIKCEILLKLNPVVNHNNFRIEKSIQSYNISFEAQYIDDADELTSTELECFKKAGFVDFAKTIEIKKGFETELNLQAIYEKYYDLNLDIDLVKNKINLWN